MKQLLIVLTVFLSALVSAQEGVIKGKITDNFNTPLFGVYVNNNTTDEHTHSKDDGSFLIDNISAGDQLTFTFLGFQNKDINVASSDLTNEITVKLTAKIFQLDELVITQDKDPLSVISDIDTYINPVNSSQEILRKVPGLFIGQHAGGGKAEQIFLRGFDVDHGTDVSISVDGMPVNMVSHAHGQGYADLHFLIPETIDALNFGKGPHYAEQGNFNTAGYVTFKTKENFDANSLKLEVGDFNTYRTLGLFNLIAPGQKQTANLALEYIESDGPFESPQNFNRVNLSGKFSTRLANNDKLSLGVSHFTSRWDASGQIPERAVVSGLINRFGAIDDTEGGTTSRTNINTSLFKSISDNTTFTANAFYSLYDFQLFSNFTFFLNDPVNGDQIKQQEQRAIFGFNTKFNTDYALDKFDVALNYGFGLRNDVVNDNELSRTLNREEVLSQISFGDVNETNMYAFTEANFNFGNFKVMPALRLDYFKYLYVDELASTYETQQESKAILNPKLTISYDPNKNLNVFAKASTGFHGNDTRVVVAEDGEDILPRAYGLDLGVSWKPISNLFLNATAWYLGLEQEFVYVGDEGIVEPSGETRRLGIDFSTRYQLTDWLFFDSDFTYTHARSLEAPDGEDYIPLAPKITAAGGLGVRDVNNFSGGLRYRYLGNRAATEDNSIIAEGYTVIDANINYRWKNIILGIQVENLFDTEWNEAQFATTSQLQNETTPTEEIHFTPGTPFFIKGSLTYQF